MSAATRRLLEGEDPAQINFTPKPEGVGNPHFLSGQLGRLPLPEFAFDFVGGLVARTILMGQGVAEITELSVGDGTLSFAGRRTGTP